MTIDSKHFEDYMLRTTVESEQLGHFVGQLSEGQPAELTMQPWGVGIFPVTVYDDGEHEPFRVFTHRVTDSDWVPTEPDVSVVYEAESIEDIRFDADDIARLSPRLILGFGQIRVKGTITLPNRGEAACPQIADGTTVDLVEDIQSHTLALTGKRSTVYQADLTLRRLKVESPSYFTQSMQFEQSA